MMLADMYRDLFRQHAKPYYSNIPYHNFIHAQQVETQARNIAQNLEMKPFDLIAISRAARMHDAGYHDHRSKDFINKEDYSIWLMQQESEKVFAFLPDDLKGELMEKAIHGINGTKTDRNDFSTDFHKVLRAADIFDLGTSETDSFLQKAANIYYEYSQLNKKELIEKKMFPLSIDVFKEKQTEILLNQLIITEKHIPERPYFFLGYYAQYKKNVLHLQNSDFQINLKKAI